MSVRRMSAAPVLLVLVACADRAPTGVAEPSLVRATPPAAAAVGVVMSGLNNPRGLAFGPEGALYVAEAGTTEITGPCVDVARGRNCFSGTGSISRLWRGQQARVVTGLPSEYNPVANDVAGPAHLGFQGRGNGWFTIGWGANPTLRAGLGAHAHGFGTLSRFTPNGAWDVAADVSALEAADNPAGGPVDSNPYGLLAEPGRTYVTDAGGNSLVRVDADGGVSLVATFAAIPVPPGPFNPPFAQSDAVPTEVRRGPDGALYVSTLTGVPFLPGAASIYRVVPGQAPQAWATGFTQVTDFDFASDGTMYVLQFASAPFFGGPGSVVRVAPGGARTTIVANLTAPAGLVVGPDGALYVSNRGTLAAVGEVLRIVP